jgi:hypothetical protein
MLFSWCQISLCCPTCSAIEKRSAKIGVGAKSAHSMNRLGRFLQRLAEYCDCHYDFLLRFVVIGTMTECYD